MVTLPRVQHIIPAFPWHDLHDTLLIRFELIFVFLMFTAESLSCFTQNLDTIGYPCTIRYERDLLESNTDHDTLRKKSDITTSTVTKPIQTSIGAEQIRDDVSKDIDKRTEHRCDVVCTTGSARLFPLQKISSPQLVYFITGFSAAIITYISSYGLLYNFFFLPMQDTSWLSSSIHCELCVYLCLFPSHPSRLLQFTPNRSLLYPTQNTSW